MQKRRNRPMFFIDIAVPRDVDPRMNKIEGIFVYDIDDLQSVAASHLAERSREADHAESIIASEVDRYHQKLQTLNVVPAIVGIQESAEEIRQAEIRRAHSRLQSLTAEQLAAVDALTRGIMNKFLHAPLQALKTAAREGDIAKVETIRKGFESVSERHAAQTPSSKDASESPNVEALHRVEAAVEPGVTEDADTVASLRSGRS
jgi:glutamyl-tRNA reductase